MVMELFGRVARDQGAAVLVVTHDHRALDVFDAIYEMEDGQATKTSVMRHRTCRDTTSMIR